MQEKPPFSSDLDFFFSNVCEGVSPSHTHPLRTFNKSSGTPLHLGKYFIKIGKIFAKIHEIGKIKAIFGLGMTPI